MSDPVMGSKPYFNSALSNTAVAIVINPTRLYGLHFINTNAGAVYVQFFDMPQGSVTVGTTTPSFVLTIPASSSTSDLTSAMPVQFSTALTIAATTGPTNGAAPGTAVTVNLFTK